MFKAKLMLVKTGNKGTEIISTIEEATDEESVYECERTEGVSLSKVCLSDGTILINAKKVKDAKPGKPAEPVSDPATETETETELEPGV